MSLKDGPAEDYVEHHDWHCSPVLCWGFNMSWKTLQTRNRSVVGGKVGSTRHRSLMWVIFLPLMPSGGEDRRWDWRHNCCDHGVDTGWMLNAAECELVPVSVPCTLEKVSALAILGRLNCRTEWERTKYQGQVMPLPGCFVTCVIALRGVVVVWLRGAVVSWLKGLYRNCVPQPEWLVA